MSEPDARTTPWWRGDACRLFLTCWIVFALHFATNFAREHYPALALAEQGNLVLDEYAGLHADIFLHTDGHHYVNNQVISSVVAAPVVFAFRPVLDALQAHSLRQLEREGPPKVDYDTEYPMRAEFFRKVRERGWALKFGAVTAITSAFVMAPLAAALVLLVFHSLLARGVARRSALWFALLFAFGTPVFYRAAILNHNLLMAVAAFASFYCVWRRSDEELPLSRKRLLWGGFFAGWTLALDYSGVIPLLALFAYVLATHWRRAGVRALWPAAPLFVVGTFPPVFLLWFTQWAQFGNLFLPAQHWMADPNTLVKEGFQGMALPSPALFVANLLDPDWGLFAFAPVLLAALVPARFLGGGTLVLPRPERRFVLLFSLAYLLFCAANRFAWLQWNTGFRYLMPLVPFLFLGAVDGLRRVPRAWLVTFCGAAVLHQWVLAMVRYTPPMRGDTNAIVGSWERFFEGGVQMPWHTVFRSTGAIQLPLVGTAGFPYVLWALVAAVLVLVWRVGREPSTG